MHSNKQHVCMNARDNLPPPSCLYGSALLRSSRIAQAACCTCMHELHCCVHSQMQSAHQHTQQHSAGHPNGSCAGACIVALTAGFLACQVCEAPEEQLRCCCAVAACRTSYTFDPITSTSRPLIAPGRTRSRSGLLSPNKGGVRSAQQGLPQRCIHTCVEGFL